eukprot:663826-Rhodomonas_salina.1
MLPVYARGAETAHGRATVGQGHKDFVLSVVFAPQGPWLISGSKVPAPAWPMSAALLYVCVCVCVSSRSRSLSLALARSLSLSLALSRSLAQQRASVLTQHTRAAGP